MVVFSCSKKSVYNYTLYNNKFRKVNSRLSYLVTKWLCRTGTILKFTIIYIKTVYCCDLGYHTILHSNVSVNDSLTSDKRARLWVTMPLTAKVWTPHGTNPSERKFVSSVAEGWAIWFPATFLNSLPQYKRKILDWGVKLCYSTALTSAVIDAILSGGINPINTFSRNFGFLESLKLATLLLTLFLYLDSVFLNSPNICTVC